MKGISIKTATQLGLAVLAACGITVALFWHHQTLNNRGVVHGVIIRDQSYSSKSGCETMAALERRAFMEPGIGPDSTVAITVTGDGSTAFEPQLPLTVQVPFNRKVIDPRNAVTERQQQIIQDADSRCRQLPQRTISPIFLALKRAVEHLRGLGCGSGKAACFVLAETDGEENAESQIRVALNGGKLGTLPTPIDNAGIKVTMCGTAETLGAAIDDRGRTHQITQARDGQRVERLRQVWLQLFANPDLVELQPYCPKN